LALRHNACVFSTVLHQFLKRMATELCQQRIRCSDNNQTIRTLPVEHAQSMPAFARFEHGHQAWATKS